MHASRLRPMRDLCVTPQVWAAAWRGLNSPALLAARAATPHGAGTSSMQSAGKRGRSRAGGDRGTGGRDRDPAKAPAETGPAHGRGPRLALQGVAARPRAQLLALALVALEQGVAALPPSTLRQGLPGRLSGLLLQSNAAGASMQGVAALPPSTLRCLLGEASTGFLVRQGSAHNVRTQRVVQC